MEGLTKDYLIKELYEVENTSFASDDTGIAEVLGTFYYAMKTSAGWVNTYGLLPSQRFDALKAIRKNYPYIRAIEENLTQEGDISLPHLKVTRIYDIDKYLMMLELIK